jgi:hypothetical protein
VCGKFGAVTSPSSGNHLVALEQGIFRREERTIDQADSQAARRGLCFSKRLCHAGPDRHLEGPMPTFIEWITLASEIAAFVVSEFLVLWVIGAGMLFALKLLVRNEHCIEDSLFEGDKLIYRS